MTLTSELKALRNQSRDLPINERAELACRAAKRFEKIGEYDAAYEALSEFWPDRNQSPNVEGLAESSKGELLLRTGALAGWLGAADQTRGSQEAAKDLITKSIEIFESRSETKRVAEARGELALCYWREGSYDEARIHLASALNLALEVPSDLRATLMIRAATVEISAHRLSEAFRIFNESATLVERSLDHALKGSYHSLFAVLFRRLVTKENSDDYVDRALIEYAAASFHFEQAGNRRYLARVENNLGFLYFTIGRYKDAHEHLDRARHLFILLEDVGTVAQVDETRARTLLAEGRLSEADRIIKMAVKTLEKGGQQAILAEALTTQGSITARLGKISRARNLLQRAIEVAETCGDLEAAGRARLSVIEELSNQTPAEELASIFHEAADLLEKSQDPAAVRRLVSSALKIIDTLLVQIAEKVSLADESWEGFSLRREVKKFEGRFIERALRDAGGSVTKASYLLGFGHHQNLISILTSRHRDLQGLRSVKRRRRSALLAKLKRGKPKPALDPSTSKLSILHVEDHKIVARLVEELLSAEGIHVDGCANGAAAWEILTGGTRYDALVVDNNLPGLSGLELVLRVRSLPRLRNLPTIMLSGDDCEREAWRAGVNAFLRKSEAVDQLTAVIQRVVAQRRKG
ncbi:MAG TPA: response regulator [Pyrinomonadaceae bacterium]|nr:response regulator [Pyrinomonadaceae bacterium]